MLKRIAERHSFVIHNAKMQLVALKQMYFNKEDVEDENGQECKQKLKKIIELMNDTEYWLDKIPDVQTKHKAKYEADHEPK